MPSRQLGRGLALTELGLGAAQFGNLYRPTTDEESTAAVRVAWDGGIRYFDTAPHYGLGLSEKRLGNALREYPRDEYVVSTKVGRLLEPSPEDIGKLDSEGFAVPAAYRRRWDFSRDGILRSVESSLERLGLDRVDILYLHDPDEFWEQASTSGVDTLIELRDQGVVGAVGAGMNQSAMLAEFVRRCDIDVVMLAGRYTLLDQGALDGLIPAASERGVAIVAAGVYNSGILSSPVVVRDAKYDYGSASAEIIDRATQIAAVCQAFGVDLPEAAIRFPLLRPEVASVVVGARTDAQVLSNLARYRAAIPAALWTHLARVGLVPLTTSNPKDRVS
jgi:D-threo-aldose 1-dehydrogenase